MGVDVWQGKESDIAKIVMEQLTETLDVYERSYTRITEEANLESNAAQGDYAKRQVYELIQNAADQLVDQAPGRVELLLTEDALYCANEGAPITEDGVRAIMGAHNSPKTGNQIGRFGLGFKSVLSVSDNPIFLGRTGSFEFHKTRSLDVLKGHVKKHHPQLEPPSSFAVLRLAWSIDPEKQFSEDQNLRSFKDWATTVIKLPFNDTDPQAITRLKQDFVSFPEEFLLFSEHVGELLLNDNQTLGNLIPTTITLSREGDNFRIEKRELTKPVSTTTWRVFKAVHNLTDRELDDTQNAQIRERKSVEISWAIPGKPQRRGRFWNFFPTIYDSTLSGILNAPWKVGGDRVSLLEGDLNNGLISTAAKLVVENLNELVDPSDPGIILDILPARGQEETSWAAEELVSTVDKLAAQCECIPNQDGALMLPSKINGCPSPQYVSHAAAEKWSAYDGRPKEWFHHSVNRTPARWATAERLRRLAVGLKDDSSRDRDHRMAVGTASVDGREGAAVTQWLEALVRDKKPEASAFALQVASQCLEDVSPQNRDYLLSCIRIARIVLTVGGNWASPNPDKLFYSADTGYQVPNLDLVHSDVLSAQGAREALSELGIGELTSKDYFKNQLGLVERTFFNFGDREWDTFWQACRTLEADEAKDVIASSNVEKRDLRRRLQAKTVSGDYRALDSCLIPDEVVSEDRDPKVAIDTEFHRDTLQIITALGVSTHPTYNESFSSEPWYLDYLDERRLAYMQWYDEEFLPNNPGANRPNEGYLEVSASSEVAPAQPLIDISDDSKVLMTERLLAVPAILEDGSIGHATRLNYPNQRCESPIRWLVRNHGMVFTDDHGPRPLEGTAGPGLKDWRFYIPVAERLTIDQSRSLGMPNALEDLTHDEFSNLIQQREDINDDKLLGELYIAIARSDEHDVPENIRCRVGQDFEDVPTGDIVVTSVRDEFNRCRTLLSAVLLCGSDEDALFMREAWGMHSYRERITERISPSGAEDPEILSETFPLLDEFPNYHDHMETAIVSCESLEIIRESGDRSVTYSESLYFSPPTIYVTADVDHTQLLNEVNRRLNLNLNEDEIREILEDNEREEQRLNKIAIRELTSDEERLLAMLGPEGIKRRIPDDILNIFEVQKGNVSDRDLPSIALGCFGMGILKEYELELRSSGYAPPDKWGGSPRAKTYVQDLGFPPEYAGYENPRRPPYLIVPALTNLPDLHPYQTKVLCNLRDLLNQHQTVSDEEYSAPRSLLSLPTGSGKTRVAVQGIAEWISECQRANSLVIWVAQTDELCEQAVIAWNEVWSSMRSRDSLRISRLWGAHESEPYAGNHVVVATIDKLSSILKRPRTTYGWMNEPDCLIIDEAHRAIVPEYNTLYKFLGLDRRRSNKKTSFIGLTATPFKGNSEIQTKRLVDLFDGNRLDHGVFQDDDPYRQLQDEGYLAQVDHDILQGDDLSLTDDEQAQAERFRFSSLPHSVIRRLEKNEARTRQLLIHVQNLFEKNRGSSVLIYGVSVSHSQAISAYLNSTGISSACISSDTQRAARRYYVDAFKSGTLKVLTNHSVLAEGFDAPSVDAIYIARPIYSPNLYQQIIGRGLRGPKNGGKERCLIVNTDDTIRNFGKSPLSWHEFEYLWDA